MTNKELTCPAVVAKLTEYLEQAAAPRQMQRIAAHLRGCSECRASYEELVRNVNILSNLPNEPAPPTLKAAILAELDKQTPSEK